MGSRMGFQYRYRFGMDDEIISRLGTWRSESWRRGIRYLFEVRTNFIVKQRSDDGEILLESERYDTGAWEHSTEGYLGVFMGYRLKDYWMSDDEIQELVRKALAFAKQRGAEPQHASYRVIPIAVDLDVCTVQQEGEPIDATIDRAIKAEHLIPLDIVQINQASTQKGRLDCMLQIFLKEKLDTIRVEDVDKGLSLMEECPICLRQPTIGTIISSLRCCHTFHYHCIVRWLKDNRSCPMCGQKAHNSISLIDSFFEKMNL